MNSLQNIVQYVVLGTWILIGIFVLINVLLGIKRGTKKTLVYTISSITTTLVVLLVLSFLSIKIIFPTMESLLLFLERVGLNLSGDSNIVKYLHDPSLEPIIYGVLDIAFKLVAFIIVFIVVKIILRLLVFKRIIKNIDKENEIHPIFNKKYKPSGSSKLGGTLIGGFRGLMLSYLLLIPLIVLVGTTSYINTDSITNNNNQLNTDTTKNTINIDQSTLDLLESVIYLRDNTIVGFSKKLTINNSSLDEIIFDFGFGSKIKHTNGKVDKLKLANELRNVSLLANEALEAGVLNKDFTIDKISYENSGKYIENIFQHLSKSELLDIIIPVALEFAIKEEGLIKNFDLQDKNLEKTLKLLGKIDWSNEILQYGDVVINLLQTSEDFGELKDLIKTPADFLKLDSKYQQQLGKTINELSGVKTLSAINLGIGYMIQNEMLPKVQNGLSYEEYYYDKLSFLFDNPEFLLNDNGEITKVGNLVINLFSGKTEVDYSELLANGKFDFKQLLSEEFSEPLSLIINFMADFDLVLNAIPVVADYVLYKDNDGNNQQMLDDLSNQINDIDFSEEFEGIDSIYKEVIKLGLDKVLGTGDTLTVVDTLLMNNKNKQSIQTIVNKIFVDSDFVSTAIDYGSKIAVEQLVKNEDLKQFLITALEEESFVASKEIVNIINIAQNVYEFTTLKEISRNLANKDYLSIVYNLSNMDEIKFKAFKEDILNLQLFNVEDPRVVNYLMSSLKFSTNHIPKDATLKDVAYDFGMVLDLAYTTSLTMKENNVHMSDLGNTPLSKLINGNKVNEIMTYSENSLLYPTLVNILRNRKVKLGNNIYLEAPEDLKQKDPKSIEWQNEINSLVHTLFTILSYDDKDEPAKLTYNSLVGNKNFNGEFIIGMTNRLVGSLNEENIDSNNKDALDRFLGGRIIHNTINNLLTNDNLDASITKILVNALGNEEIEMSIKPYDVHKDENGFILVQEVKDILLITKYVDLVNNGKITFNLNTLYKVIDDEKFDEFLSSNYFRSILSRLLENDGVKGIFAKSGKFEVSELDLEHANKDSSGLTSNEIEKLIIGIRTLGITDAKNINFDKEILKDLLADNKLETVLESNYLYQIIDLMLKSEITDIPETAFGDTYPGYISKGEIRKLIELLDELDLADANGFNSETLRVKDLENVVNKDSIIVRSLMSKELIKQIDFPESSYEGNMENQLIKQEELVNLVKAINIMVESNETLLKDIDFNNLTITREQLNELVAIDSENGGSPFINRTITTVTNKALDKDKMPQEAFTSTDNKDDLKREEIEKLVEIFEILKIENLGANISLTNITTSQITELLDLESIIMNKMLSDKITENANTNIEIPDSARIGGISSNDIKPEEIRKLFEAITSIGGTLQNLENLDVMDKSFEELSKANNVGSVILSRLISNSLFNISNNTNSGLIISNEVLSEDSKDIDNNEINNLLSNANESGYLNLNDVMNTLEKPEDNSVRIFATLVTLNDIKSENEDNVSRILIDSLNEAKSKIPQIPFAG